MLCPRCKNSDVKLFYKSHKGYYCLKCAQFKIQLMNEEVKVAKFKLNNRTDHNYNLPFKLSDKQLEASKKLLKISLQHKFSLLYCVCGAGKTEILVPIIAYYLNKGYKIAFAIPRVEVVKEIYERYKRYFNNSKVVAVYGGNTKELDGDLIISSIHQLYRYHQSFDLLIIDEIDAFPLKNNHSLFNIALNATKNKCIFSSATLDSNLEELIKQDLIKLVSLNVRPHQRDLKVPILKRSLFIPIALKLLYYMYKINKPVMIFFPSIKLMDDYYKYFKFIFKLEKISSKTISKDEIVNKFREGELNYLFTTSILERGVSIKGVSVIVVYADNLIFDYNALVQIAGRVDRDFNVSKGDVYFLYHKLSMDIKKAVLNIKTANKHKLD